MTTLTTAHMARLAAKTRNLADDFAEAGYVELPDWLRALADITEGKFPCGHEPSGPPIDGREVDRAPEDKGVAFSIPRCKAISRQYGRCERPAVHSGLHWTGGAQWLRPIPQTGGGSVASPEADPPPPHRWLFASEAGAHRDCTCLIGDDHVAEPRFEKES